jgi:hypothetical protein
VGGRRRSRVGVSSELTPDSSSFFGGGDLWKCECEGAKAFGARLALGSLSPGTLDYIPRSVVPGVFHEQGLFGLYDTPLLNLHLVNVSI